MTEEVPPRGRVRSWRCAVTQSRPWTRRRCILWVIFCGGAVLISIAITNPARYMVMDRVGLAMTVAPAVALYVPWARGRRLARQAQPGGKPGPRRGWRAAGAVLRSLLWAAAVACWPVAEYARADGLLWHSWLPDWAVALLLGFAGSCLCLAFIELIRMIERRADALQLAQRAEKRLDAYDKAFTAIGPVVGPVAPRPPAPGGPGRFTVIPGEGGSDQETGLSVVSQSGDLRPPRRRGAVRRTDGDLRHAGTDNERQA